MPRKALFVYTICLLSLIPIIKADPNFLFMDCPNTTNAYAPNSTYQTNLDTLFSVLSSNSTVPSGFYNFTAGGSPPNLAYGLFLCRGDVTPAVCEDCVSYATVDVVEKCPRSKLATIWYDECMLSFQLAAMQNKEGEFCFIAVMSVLEIIFGKKNRNFYQSNGAADLLSYAWTLWREGTPLDLMDPTLERSHSRNEVTRCIHIALLCVQDDPNSRPSMATVVLMLNSHSASLSLPQQPGFLGRSKTGSNVVEELRSD
ncbi:hypothetical protein RHSIM_Rhsim13G0161300 [Rhododendron simsii]|uniref:Gnk2-homologous domain-containing protein n=1 Tax=Rhododendron simsii TaxID=118357 RepID=A0A834G1N7_RHOSS|nr:hypothetical protein RHSIM_Rhsim13G0161300 [Rhododendron simsii]